MYIVPVLFNNDRGEMDYEEYHLLNSVRHEFQTENPYISDTMFRHKGTWLPYLVVKDESDIPNAKSRCKTELEFKFGISVRFGKPEYHTLEWVRKNFDIDKPKIHYNFPLRPWDHVHKTRWDHMQPRPDHTNNVIQIRKKKISTKPKRKTCRCKK